MDSQCDIILRHIHDKGSITAKQATALEIYRLSARIADLRAAGYPITTLYEQKRKPNGRYTRYARYVMGA